MTFTRKSWHNDPQSDTPVSAVGLDDLEARILNGIDVTSADDRAYTDQQVLAISTGDKGDTGATGEQGPPGGGVYHGPYDAGHPYVPTDVCKGSDGMYYQNILGCTGVNPVTDTDESNWIGTIPRSVLTNARLRWFDVTDYGAVGNGITDDTAAIQAAVDACIAAGGGTVYFAAGTYLVAGALQTGGAWCTQIKLGSAGNPANKLTLQLVGDRSGNINNEWGRFGGAISGGSWIISNSTGATWGTNSKVPSIVGGPASTTWENGGSGAAWNLHVVLRDLICQSPANPRITGFDLGTCRQAEVDRVCCTTADAPDFPTEPTNPVGIGVILPGINNTNSIDVPNFAAFGQYQGLVWGEHTNGGDFMVARCIVGVGPWSNNYHPSHFTHLDVERCKYPVGVNDWTGGAATGYGPVPVEIALLATENPPASVGLPAWCRVTKHINDPGHILHGHVNYTLRPDRYTGPTPWNYFKTISNLVARDVNYPRSVACRAYPDSSALSIPSGADTQLSLTTWPISDPTYGPPALSVRDGFDELLMLGQPTPATTMTAPTDGWYLIQMHLKFAVGAGSKRAAMVRKSGLDIFRAETGPFQFVTLSHCEFLPQGATLQFYAYQDSGSPLDLMTEAHDGGVTPSVVTVTRLF
jgi:Pectate lyase superfamily protein